MVFFTDRYDNNLYRDGDNVIHDVKKYKLYIFYGFIIVLIGNVSLALVQDFLFPAEKTLTKNWSWSVYLLSAFFVPFFEETIMRGILQRWLNTLYCLGSKMVIIIVASIFSALHGEFYFIPYFFTSVVLSVIYNKTEESLITTILVHSLYNNFVIIFSYLLFWFL